MAGTTEGGKKAAKKNIKNHGKDFYKRIGSMGGKNGTTGGFYANRELARAAGAKGGRISRRTKPVAKTMEYEEEHKSGLLTNIFARSFSLKRSK